LKLSSRRSLYRPHAFIEFKEDIEAQYVRYQHVFCSNKYLAISEFRVFGLGSGKKPAIPKNFSVKREEDRRNAFLSWSRIENSQGYVLYWGLKPDKLNNSVLIYDKNEYDLRALNIGEGYFFQVEAFNENGISSKSEVIKSE
jgi:hypothetical protein